MQTAGAGIAQAMACLDGSQVGFLQRLSSRDLLELGELAGVTAMDGTSLSAEWDSVVIDSVRCLPPAGSELVKEALIELGYRKGQWATEVGSGGSYTLSVGSQGDLFEVEDRVNSMLARDAVDLDVHHDNEEEVHRRRAHDARLGERLIVPGSCWDAARGSQVFFADPPIHLDPADPTRHSEYAAGQLGMWDFGSEQIVFRAGVCFPPGSPYTNGQNRCKVFFTHSQQSDPESLGEVVCRAPFDDGHASSTHVLSHDAETEEGGVLVTLCTPIQLFDYSPGTQWLSLNLTCLEPLTGLLHQHHAELNMAVHWQAQPWTRQATAWGRGLRHGWAGEEAVFTVQMVTRAGLNASAGGDHLLGHLVGPSILTSTVTDKGDGTYHMSFIAWDAGVYTLEVMITYLEKTALADPHLSKYNLHPRDVVYAHIQGSPFTVEVAPSRTESAPPIPREVGGHHSSSAVSHSGDQDGHPGEPWAPHTHPPTHTPTHPLGGLWAPYLHKPLPVCNRRQSLQATGRWVERSRCKLVARTTERTSEQISSNAHLMSMSAGSRAEEGGMGGAEALEGREVGRGCTFAELAQDHDSKGGAGSDEYVWVMTHCDAVRYSRNSILECAARRRQNKLVIAGFFFFLSFSLSFFSLFSLSVFLSSLALVLSLSPSLPRVLLFSLARFLSFCF